VPNRYNLGTVKAGGQLHMHSESKKRSGGNTGHGKGRDPQSGAGRTGERQAQDKKTRGEVKKERHKKGVRDDEGNNERHSGRNSKKKKSHLLAGETGVGGGTKNLTLLRRPYGEKRDGLRGESKGGGGVCEKGSKV